MVEMILQLKRAGVAVLLSEQNLHFAALVSDRACVIESGQVRYQGTMQQLLSDSATQQAYLAL